MRFRFIAAILIILSIGAFVSTGGASARSTPRCNGKVATIVGSGAINGTEGNDVIVGSKGADVINGAGGIDTICGLDGDDNISLGGSGSWADGGSGDDQIHASFGAKALGGSGYDKMWAESDAWVLGGSGEDDLYISSGGIGDGGSNNDLLFGEDAQKLLGGSGQDWLIDDGGTVFMDCGSDRDYYETDNDPTVRRCENFQRYCGCLMVPELLLPAVAARQNGLM